ncbi:MAG: class I SAM-dependent methyltransferase [Candidatus Heimdallarchaeota archaeon]
MNSRDFMLKGINLQDLVVMDAGTGAANTTLWLAQKLNDAGSSEIISIDHNPDTFPDAKRKLNKFAKLVGFVATDLTCIPIKSGSIDLIVSHATMCAINDRPLKAVKALSEFFRVIKKGGWLLINDEYPLPKASTSKEEVQVKRWQIYKALAELVEGDHYTEIFPEELEFAAKFAGFQDVEWKRFEGGPLSEEVMNEWSEAISKMIHKIDDKDLQAAFRKVVERISEEFKNHGGVFPPYYVMRMRK